MITTLALTLSSLAMVAIAYRVSQAGLGRHTIAMVLVIGFAAGGAEYAQAQCPNVPGTKSGQSVHDGQCTTGCTADENQRLGNVAVLALNAQPPRCATGCTVGAATDGPPVPDCNNISTTTHVCKVSITRTQACAVATPPSSGVEDPLMLTLLLVALASLICVLVFRR